jgi:hypothetical protein
VLLLSLRTLTSDAVTVHALVPAALLPARAAAVRAPTNKLRNPLREVQLLSVLAHSCSHRCRARAGARGSPSIQVEK